MFELEGVCGGVFVMFVAKKKEGVTKNKKKKEESVETAEGHHLGEHRAQ